MATIRDVAERACVSPATVSQVLNGRGKLRPETRKRIHAAAEQLGYQKRPVGRPQRQAQQGHHFALLLGGLNQRSLLRYPMQRVRFQYLRQQLEQMNDQLSIFYTTQSVEENWAFREMLETAGFDGVIIMASPAYAEYAGWLRSYNIPAVVAGRNPVKREFSSVCVDSYHGGWLVGEHMVRLGHRQLAFLWQPGPPANQQIMLDRRDGFAAAVAAGGAAMAGTWTGSPDPDDPQQAKAVIHQLQKQDVTGVFVASDGLAVRWIEAWQAAGVRVPQDLSVAGFDNANVQTQSGLRPTSVGNDNDYFIQVVIRTLKQLIAERDRWQTSVSIRPYLVEHDTTAAPPKNSQSTTFIPPGDGKCRRRRSRARTFTLFPR